MKGKAIALPVERILTHSDYAGAAHKVPLRSFDIERLVHESEQ
jgi:hypothetical protein